MTKQISALEHRPCDFVREVSIETINFYAGGLSGLYLPDDFKHANAEVSDVNFWKSENRLRGKFGRFTLRLAEEDEQAELDDILVMGATIGLHGLDSRGRMESLRHYNLYDCVLAAKGWQDLLGRRVMIDAADYGATHIELDDRDEPSSISISSSSIDYGRGNTDSRRQTCELFKQLLDNRVRVINADPVPHEYERTIT